jgi:hypothetical protein
MSDPVAVRTGINNGCWVLQTKDEHGWFPHMNMTIGKDPLLHTVAYTINGLYELGVLTRQNAFVDAAKRMLPIGFAIFRTNAPGYSRHNCVSVPTRLYVDQYNRQCSDGDRLVPTSYVKNR